MQHGPPGVSVEDARRMLADAKASGHDPRQVAEHIPEGGRELAIQHEMLRDIHADERRNLSEVRRNL